MGQKISILWWNVHNLKDITQAARIVLHIKERNPDVFGLGEVIGEAAYRFIAKEFPEYNFYMTFGKQAQEMLVGVRRNLQAFFSQRTEFQSGNEFLRPAALVTISLGEPPLNLLFVHLKSLTDPLSLGYRDSFLDRLGDNPPGSPDRCYVARSTKAMEFFYGRSRYLLDRYIPSIKEFPKRSALNENCLWILRFSR